MNPLSSSSASEWINMDFPIDGKQLWPDGLTCSKVRPRRAPNWPHSAAPCRPSPTERQLIPVAFVSEKWFEISCWPPEGLDHFLWVEKTSWIHALVGTGPRWPLFFFLFFFKSLSELLTPPLSLRWGCPTLGIVGNLAYVCFCCTTTLASMLYKGRWKGGRDTRHQRYLKPR